MFTLKSIFEKAIASKLEELKTNKDFLSLSKENKSEITKLLTVIKEVLPDEIELIKREVNFCRDCDSYNDVKSNLKGKDGHLYCKKHSADRNMIKKCSRCNTYEEHATTSDGKNMCMDCTSYALELVEIVCYKCGEPGDHISYNKKTETYCCDECLHPNTEAVRCTNCKQRTDNTGYAWEHPITKAPLCEGCAESAVAKEEGITFK